jgi:hypothetical protein
MDQGSDAGQEIDCSAPQRIGVTNKQRHDEEESEGGRKWNQDVKDKHCVRPSTSMSHVLDGDRDGTGARWGDISHKVSLGPRPATSAGVGHSSANLDKGCQQESEVFGLLMESDLYIGVAAQHERDYYLSSSFSTPKSGAAIFSRPLKREVSQERMGMQPAKLTNATLCGEEKPLLEQRPESPLHRGSKVKPQPKSGLSTVQRELERRRKSPPPSQRNKTRKVKISAALYLDVNEGNRVSSGRASSSGGAGLSGDDGRREGGAVEEGEGLIALFPSSPQLRCVCVYSCVCTMRVGSLDQKKKKTILC